MTLLAKIALGGLALATLTASLLPAELDVSRSRVVRGTAAEVEHHIATLTQRPQWVAWTETDPGARYTFSGTPGEVGSTMSWDGEEIGRATLTLQSWQPGRIVSQLDYDAPMPMRSLDVFEVTDLGDGTSRVTWRAQGELPLGSGRVFALFADGLLGPDYDRGLERLDALLASN